MRFACAALLLSALAPAAVWGQAAPAQASPNVDQMRQMLDASVRRGTLAMEGTEPFHLVASFEEFDAKGKAAGKGTVEELWAGLTRYRETITQPAMKRGSNGRFEEDLTAPPAVLVSANDGTQAWRTGQWVIPQAEGLAIEAVMNPFWNLSPATKRLSYAGDFEKDKTLECIGTEPDLPGVADDVRLALTSYCMEKGNHIVRVLLQPNLREIVFNDVEPFGGKFVARSVSVAIDGVVREKIHIDLLEPAKDVHALSEPAPSGAQMLPSSPASSPYPYRLSGEVMQGQLLSGGQHWSDIVGDLHGTIVLYMHVDTAGSVTGADVLRSSSPAATVLVVAAVKRWRFRVSYRGDRIVPISFLFTVNF